MNIIIAGGTGFIGQYLVNCYLASLHNVTVIGRSRAKIDKIFNHKVTAKDWNTIQQTGLECLKKANLLINLSGSGIADQKWTGNRKKEILRSRITATEILSNACAKLRNESPPLFNASAIGVYGIQKNNPDGLPPKLTESTTIQYNKNAFSQEVVRRWELSTKPALEAGVRVVNMRFGVVFGKKGGALSRLKLPFMLGLGGKIGTGRQPFSWIALPDLKRAIDFLLDNPVIKGAVNFTSPHCITQKEFAKTMGSVLKRPAIFPTPAFILHKLYGQMADELLLNGQNVYPEILLQHGFHFETEKLRAALEYSLK